MESLDTNRAALELRVRRGRPPALDCARWAVAAESNAQGVKARGKIYLGDALIAEHGEHTSGARWVEWKHDEPVTGKNGVSGPDAYFSPDEAGERDPAGMPDFGYANSTPSGEKGLSREARADPFRPF